ncbi:MAG: hypothetical protein Q8N89_10890, partial [Azonexus sp.]|nr:hypothetical protein [Azonexus sp.]
MNLETSVDRSSSLGQPHEYGPLCAFEAIDPLADSATRPLARLVGRPALSLLLAGMSLLRTTEVSRFKLEDLGGDP